MAEAVRLVIWDLDDTFWSGTLTEGGAKIVPENVEIVKELSRRGIVNSICSKNNPDAARAQLEAAGAWEYFVFPQIDWVAKGAMVRRIVEWSQLRPETILFIDDNPINRNEVRHANPDLQIADVDVIPNMLRDPLFKGKQDPDLSRLKQYKVLEKKEIDRSQFEDRNHDFLAQSNVAISFHHDVLGEFDRIYELVNRTNQLNFTKNRWSEDKAQARRDLEDLLNKDPTTYVAYIKATDNYGDYGVVGFYMSRIGTYKTKDGPKRGGRVLEHFVFSCRILNMGIEQFVYRRLNSPRLEIVGEVVSELKTDENIDWITVCADAAHRAREETSGPKLKVCIRGSCELDQAIHYMGHRFDISREFNFAFRGWAVPFPAAQFFTLWSTIDDPRHSEIKTRVPSLHKSCLDNALRSGRGEAFVFSFSLEAQWSHYAFKATGLEIPFRLNDRNNSDPGDLTKLSLSELHKLHNAEISEADWEWFRTQFEYVGRFSGERFARNLRDLRPYIADKPSLFVMLNTKHGKPRPMLEFNAQVNEIVRAQTVGLPVRFVELDDLIAGPDEVVDAQHFRRPVYPRLADAISQFITEASRAPALA